jgi:3D (Asp-Asp-Asp) domain-containing protein
MPMRRFVATLGCAVLLSFQPSPASSAPAIRAQTTMRLMATAYCAKGRTKSGVGTRTGVVAADPRVLPLGTVLRILDPGKPYAGTYTVMDTGSQIKGREIDIFMPSCANATRFGRKAVHVRVIRRGGKANADVVR